MFFACPIESTAAYHKEGTCLQDSPEAIVLQSDTVSEVEVGEVQLQVQPLAGPLLQTEVGEAEVGLVVEWVPR